MGVAYHAHYLVWFELGRTELMRELGCPYGVLEQRDGVFFPVVEAGARYLAAARYDDLLTIRTCLTSVSRARVRFDYRLTRGQEPSTIATGFTEHAAMGRGGRVRRIPETLLRRLESWECGE